MTVAPERFNVGDLVACGSREYRDELRLEPEIGLYLAGRRRDGLVLFGAAGRSVWIPHRALIEARVDDPRLLQPPAWLLSVHKAMRLLAASDVTIEESEAGQREARIGCPGFDLPTLGQLVELLGDGLRILPGSMSRVLVVATLASTGGSPADVAAIPS